MLERTLKKISDLGYEVSWRYEPSTNSIIIRARNGEYMIDQRVDLKFGGYAAFEFYLNRYLIIILNKLEEMENH